MLITSLALAATLTTAPLPLDPRPAAPLPEPREPSSASIEDGITWFDGAFSAALGAAAKKDTHVLIYFWSDQSGQCTNMYGQTMAAEPVQAEMNEMVPFSANTGQPNGYELVERFHVTTLPTVLAVKADGTVDDGVFGFIDAEGFTAELQRIQRGTDTISDFERRVGAAPDDIDLHFSLAIKYQDCGVGERYEAAVAALKQKDPRGETIAVARLFLQEVRDPIVAACRADDGSYDWTKAELKPLYKHLAGVEHEKLLYEAWAWVAHVEREAERRPKARLASMKAWDHANEQEGAHEYGREVAARFFEDREELSKKERKFALKVANAAYELVALHAMEATAEAEAAGGEGCASYEGCEEGEGCGGCEGKKGEIARWEADYLGTLACAYFMNGKKRKAIETLEQALAKAPGSEELMARMETIRGRKSKG